MSGTKSSTRQRPTEEQIQVTDSNVKILSFLKEGREEGSKYNMTLAMSLLKRRKSPVVSWEILELIIESNEKRMSKGEAAAHIEKIIGKKISHTTIGDYWEELGLKPWAIMPRKN
ncbi:MAG: hypothetical protein ABR981_06040 [Candidatus Micrarchaeaceae archaeon]